jgi:hypothetical protein
VLGAHPYHTPPRITARAKWVTNNLFYFYYVI